MRNSANLISSVLLALFAVFAAAGAAGVHIHHHGSDYEWSDRDCKQAEDRDTCCASGFCFELPLQHALKDTALIEKKDVPVKKYDTQQIHCGRLSITSFPHRTGFTLHNVKPQTARFPLELAGRAPPAQLLYA